jgi:hypothetical protein
MTISRGPRARGGDNEARLATADRGAAGRHYDDCDQAGATAPSPNEAGDVTVVRLMRVIERDIIPRLFLTHLAATPSSRRGPAAILADNESAAFAEFILVSDTTQIRTRLELLCTRGVSLERIYLDLVAPAARQLREFGNRDSYDVDAVSRGLARLRQVLGDLGRRPVDMVEATGAARLRTMQ